MPHGLQQASAASFFPTAKELSSGVQWFRDHPVLAAAAATAVSVITYLNALELEDAPSAPEASAAHKPPVARPSLSRKSSGHSDGRLSTAVSWCDEHGGSLTQVFEEEDSDSEDDVAASILEPFGRRPLRKSGTTPQLESSSSIEENEAQTDSPQWGWYVPITPPQDQFVQSTREAVAEPEDVKKPMRRTISGRIP